AVLPHQLPARPARRPWHFALRDHDDRIELALARRQRRKQRDTLRADRQSIRAILDIAAAKDFATLRAQRRPDFEFREGGNRVFARLDGFVDERLVDRHGGRNGSMARHSIRAISVWMEGIPRRPRGSEWHVFRAAPTRRKPPP